MQRLWLIAAAAEAFHVSPLQVADELERDPDDLIPICLSMLRYAEAKAAFDGAKDKTALEPWEKSRMMDLVTKNTFEIHKERIAKRKEQSS